MSVIASNIHQMISLVKNEEILSAIEILLRANVPTTDIDEELSEEEQEMLREARTGVYERLND